MLVLTRKQNQSIRIGEVIVTVLRTGPRGASIGIQAPRHVPIKRTEILGRDASHEASATPAEAAA